MPTTLQDARRALLELQHMPIHAESHIGTRLKTIEQYLNAQVALNVESLPAHIVSKLGSKITNPRELMADLDKADKLTDDMVARSMAGDIPLGIGGNDNPRAVVTDNGMIIGANAGVHPNHNGGMGGGSFGRPTSIRTVKDNGVGGAGAPWCYIHGNYKHYCNCQSGAGGNNA